jgi:chloramphenicol-sensitive protein RarD
MKRSQMQTGMAAAALCYFIWGLLPIYWKLLGSVPSFEILAHRMTWSLPFTILFLIIFRHRLLSPYFKNITVLKHSFICSSLLAANWLIYIWAVNSGYIVETSLGYYINPLVSVSFGVFFMKERLRSGQVAAIVLAAIGVVYLTFVYGTFPWIALALAMSFAVYGLLHKKTKIAPLEGLHLETMMFFVPAASFLLLLEFRDSGAFLHAPLSISMMLAGTGLVTTIPLLLFAYAAQNIPLSLLGILQYIAPSLNLLIGVFLYHEEFPMSRLIGFLLVWSALLVYMVEGSVRKVRHRRLKLERAG